MIRIVKAEEKDFPTIRSIAHRTWPETFGNILSKDQISYMLEWMYSLESLGEQVAQKHVFLIAKDKEEALGFAAYELNYQHSGKTKIHKIYILPSAQGKGIGKQLLSTIADATRENGNATLSLNVNRHNPAVDVYKKLGYQIVTEEDIDIDGGFFMNDYVMEKVLTQ